MTYEQALAWIAALEKRGWRLGLDRMQEFVRRANLEHAVGGTNSPKYIHVAGTNGKGSVTAFVQSMLVESGHWTGAFFSPYVYDPRERIQFNRQLIPKNVLAMMTQLLGPIAESLSDTEFGGVTEFEFKTALGFQFWSELNCEWVALEVGLGGRFDATNVVTPAASVIVSIGLDHTAILGDTLEAIAFEKAGIIKPALPVVVGDLGPGPMAVVERRAAELSSPLWRLGREVQLSPIESGGWVVSTPAGSHHGLVPGLFGSRQPANMALAVAALDAAGATRTLRGLVDGAHKAFVPGRFQRLEAKGRHWLLDGAHNVAAAEVLVESVRLLFETAGARRIVLIAGMMAGHDPNPFFSELSELADSVILAPIQHDRSLQPQELSEAVGCLAGATCVASSSEAVQTAVDATTADDLVLVTGSFYLVGEIGKLLGAASSGSSA